jgi:hypothetical protein
MLAVLGDIEAGRINLLTKLCEYLPFVMTLLHVSPSFALFFGLAQETKTQHYNFLNVYRYYMVQWSLIAREHCDIA